MNKTVHIYFILRTNLLKVRSSLVLELKRSGLCKAANLATTQKLNSFLSATISAFTWSNYWTEQAWNVKFLIGSESMRTNLCPKLQCAYLHFLRIPYSYNTIWSSPLNMWQISAIRMTTSRSKLLKTDSTWVNTTFKNLIVLYSTENDRSIFENAISNHNISLSIT